MGNKTLVSYFLGDFFKYYFELRLCLIKDSISMLTSDINNVTVKQKKNTTILTITLGF
jgi:hypothetical protein